MCDLKALSTLQVFGQVIVSGWKTKILISIVNFSKGDSFLQYGGQKRGIGN